jgi:uncharacterized protein YegL
MASWAVKRQIYYGTTFVVITGLVFFGIFWKLFYKVPTCTDGIQNGEEKGIDCGGSCKNLCTSDTLTPVVLWSKVFHISGDVYTAVAYIQNPNITSKNPKATYRFKIYDENNNIIETKNGETSIPKNKKFAVFETGLVIKNKIPKSADFEFLSFAPWQKEIEKENTVNVEYGTLLSTTTSPKITGTISNTSQSDIESLELDVFVLDGKENVVAASRSFVDNLIKGSSQDFVFTWPKPFDLGVEACVNPVDLVVALDRSGSMKAESVNPAEPFTTVLNTAKNFIKNLRDDDEVGIVTFGNNAKLENGLTSNKNQIISTISNLVLSTTTLEQTNIDSGLKESFNELRGSSGRSDSRKILVLLTDGVPTEPKSSSQSDYPEVSAQKTAASLKDNNIIVYTIGLGKNVSESFLKSLSYDDSHYFFAPSKDVLTNIYNQIGNSLCERKPNVITVIYRAI